MAKRKNVSEKMQIEQINIEELKHPERNVRIHTERQLKELKRSLEMFGQTRPAVVDEDNVILIGNGMVEAMREMGITTVSVYRKTGLTKSQKIKLMLADNRIYGLGHDDSVNVQALLAEMNDFDIPGFDSEVLQALAVNVEDMEATLKNQGSLPKDEVEQTKQMEDSPDKRNIICPNCGESIWIQ